MSTIFEENYLPLTDVPAYIAERHTLPKLFVLISLSMGQRP